MSIRERIWIIAAATVSLALAGCGAAPIPDDEIAGMVGSSTALAGGDTAALSIFAGGPPTSSAKGFNVSTTIDFPGIGSLTYDYAIDYLEDGSSVADPVSLPWDEVTFDGSAHLVVDLPNYEADRTLDVDFEVTGFDDDPNDGRVVVNGASTAAGTATWTNPTTDATAGYTTDLTKTWTDVKIADPTNPALPFYPISGTIAVAGSIERHHEGPSGYRNGRWSGTVTITFDGDATASVDVNGSSYQLNLVTGEVIPGT